MTDSFYDECPYCELDSKGNHKYGCPYNPGFYDEMVKYLERRRKLKMNIQEFTKEELENELKRREEEERIRDIPKRIANPDFDTLFIMIDNFLQGISEQNTQLYDDIWYTSSKRKIEKEFWKTFYDSIIFDWIREKGY